MTDKQKNRLLSKWEGEVFEVLQKDNFLYIALFSCEGELVYTNDLMSSILNGASTENLLNPNFKELLAIKQKSPLLFEGYVTIGDYDSINSSIFAKIYRKDNELLLIGGIEAPQLLEQNKQMHQLNSDINNLQRQLIKEKTKLEKTLDKLNGTNIKLEKLNADKDLFMSILAHDLKSPFNALLGLSSLLAENLYNSDLETIEEQVGYIKNVSHRTYYLLEDLLHWSKAQSGKMPFLPSKKCAFDLCSNVSEDLIFVAKKKEIILDCSGVEKTNIFVDPNMFKTVIRNLISNAIKFSKKGDRVKIYTQKDNSNITFTISDTGVGIENHVMSKILNPLDIYTTNGTEKEQGTGLGLNLCLEFIKQHNGEIWIESQLGKGSDFKFKIPYQLEN